MCLEIIYLIYVNIHLKKDLALNNPTMIDVP